MSVTESPLRYPGGKTKLYPVVKNILNANLKKERRIYVEPYAGGAGLALRLLFHNDVDFLMLNDVDYHIFCFWNSCLNDSNHFCKMVFNTNINLQEWKRQRYIYDHSNEYSLLEVGFATFYLNRCNVSGILKGGPIGGMKQLGKYKIDARFNKNTLIKKIQKAASCRERIQLFNMDAGYFLEKIIRKSVDSNMLLNIDPPYVNKGSLLYQNAYDEEDHKKIAEIIRTIEKKWIVTYDRCELIEQLYQEYHMETIEMSYSTGKAKTGEEYLIYGHGVQDGRS